MSAVTKCRRCDKPVTWATSEGGKAMPLDLYAYDDGNVQLIPNPRGPGQIAHVMTKAELNDPPPGPRYKAHFATCGTT